MNNRLVYILSLLITTAYNKASAQNCEQLYAGKLIDDILVEEISLSYDEIRKLDRATLIHNSLIYTIVNIKNYCVIEILFNEHRAKGLDINAENTIHLFPLSAALSNNDINVLKLLLDDPNININRQDSLSGSTAIMDAAYSNKPEHLEVLLQTSEININIKNNWGLTALMYATNEGHVNIVRELLKTENIDIGIEDASGKTALDLAREGVARMNVKLDAISEAIREIIVSDIPPFLGNRAIIGRDVLYPEEKEMINNARETLQALLGKYNAIIQLLQKFQLSEIFKKK